MNQEIKTQKIKVNSGQELIAKAREYKNSGGEWKLREKFWTSPGGPGGRNTNKKYAKWGIIISNGSQEVEIYSVKIRETEWNQKKGSVLTNRLDEVDSWKELHQLFPEARFAYFAGDDKEHDEYGGRPLQSRLDFNTYKSIKETDGEYDLIRYLVAETVWNLKVILHKYIRDNETKIYQSANPHFSGWVEIIDGQDGNLYLYVGERKNGSGGREIKIGIKKEEFYSKKNHNFYAKSGGGYYSAEEMLEMAWDLFTIARPRTPAEERKYYSSTGGLEEEWQINWPHRQGLCRKYLEELRERLNKRLDYWKKEPNTLSGEIDMLTTTLSYIEAIDYELDIMKKNRPAYYAACDKNCSICGIKLCCHYEGRPCEKTKNNLFSPESNGSPAISFHGDQQLPVSPSPTRKNNQLSKVEKNQLLQYFLTYNISKITLDNGKLVIEYNSQKGPKIVSQELEKYRNLIQNQPNHSISLSDLQANNTTPQTGKPNDNKLAIGLVLGAGTVILVGIIFYFWNRKKKKA